MFANKKVSSPFNGKCPYFPCLNFGVQSILSPFGFFVFSLTSAQKIHKILILEIGQETRQEMRNPLLGCYTRCLAVLVSLFIAFPRMYSQDPELQLRYEPSPRLSVVSGESAKQVLESLISRLPQLAHGRPFAVVIANASDSPVVAMTVRWQWTGADGRPKIHDVRTDSLYLTEEPVLKARQQLVALPGLFVPEAASQFGVGNLRLPETLRQFEGGSNVSALIDCVLFRDGVVVGPDVSGTIAGLRSRKRVAAEVGRVVLDAIGTGTEPAEAARAYLQEFATVGDRSEQMWRRRLTQVLMNAKPSPETMAKRFINLAEIPATKR